MSISVIEIKNIKGIDHKQFKLLLLPNDLPPKIVPIEIGVVYCKTFKTKIYMF